MNYKIGDRVIVNKWQKPLCGIITDEIHSALNKVHYKVAYTVGGGGYFNSTEMTIDKQYYREEKLNELRI
jgi:hypothetical protein